MRIVMPMGAVVGLALSGIAAAAPSFVFQSVESSYEMFVDVGNRNGDSDVAAASASTPGAVSAVDGRVEIASVEGVTATIATAVNQSFSDTGFHVSVSAQAYGASLRVAEEGDRIFVRASRTVVGTFELTEDTYIAADFGSTAGTQGGIAAGVTVGISPVNDPGNELMTGSEYPFVGFFEAGVYSFTVRSFLEGEAIALGGGTLFADAGSTAQGFWRIVPAPFTAAVFAPIGVLATRRRR